MMTVSSVGCFPHSQPGMPERQAREIGRDATKVAIDGAATL
jgi:hypothetical protein